jgi:cytochrome d ubiquinol oxidase subunit II
MTLADAVAVVLMAGIVAYALLGGADFGAGFWDLLAGSASGGARPRAVAQHAIGPVWEANHVWLVFCLVVLWSAFPTAFSAIGSTLFVPLSLAALGIVLRGAGFAFRKEVDRESSRRNFGAAFAASSVVVPYCMGAVAGAVASGRVPAHGSGDRWSSWVNPTSILGGVLAVLVCAYLAAVYLVDDARRLGDHGMVEYFRRRALVAAGVTGWVAAAGIVVLRADARYVFDGLTARASPLVIVSVAAGVASLVLLHRGVPGAPRLTAAVAVAALVAGWGVAQYPYLLATSLRITAAAAPRGTLVAVLAVAAVGVVVLVPALGLLYVLDQKNVLDG